MDGNSAGGLGWLGWQLVGGFCGIVAVVAVVAVFGYAWFTQRAWMLVRLELIIENKKRELAEIAERATAARAENEALSVQRRGLLRAIPPEILAISAKRQ